MGKVIFPQPVRDCRCRKARACDPA